MLPDGHVLRIGESRRFGNLKIKVLRITRGPVTVRDDVLKDFTIKTEGDVFKLWLSITNVSDAEDISDAQAIVPFGYKLSLFRARAKGDDPGVVRANTFVCRAGSGRGTQVLMYKHDERDSFDDDSPQFKLEGQDVNRVLKPGETYETFLASDEEGIEDLTGELVWRVHFRKGYNPKSKRGVTTLIEINFHSDDVKQEPSAD